MSLLTSYRYRGCELNDGLAYTVPSQGLTLDDRQNADENWVYRSGGDLPMPTGITLKEGVIVLNINIVASTPEQFETRLNVLKQIFDTTDRRYYKLERKLPHEQYYKYIEVAPRQFTVSRTERKVSITLHTAERAWKEDTWREHVQELFTDNETHTYYLNVNYEGITPVEPIVEVTPLEVSSQGPQPMFYQEVDVYVASPQHIINTPIRLVGGWDTSSYVSAGQMRSDGLDITVTLPNGTQLRRYVGGTQSNRNVWINPQTWPSLPGTVRLPGFPGVTADSTEIPIFANTGTLVGMPTSGKVCIGDEIISYTGLQITSSDGVYGKLTGCTRGVDGTVATDFTLGDWTWVKFPQKLRINYGYVNVFAGTFFQNNLNNWHLIDYDESDNVVWIQKTANTSPFGDSSNGYFTGRPFSWRGYSWLPGRPGERSEMGWTGRLEGGNAQMTLSAYKTNSQFTSYRDRLVMQLNPYNSRKVTWARLVYDLTGGDTGQFPQIKAEMGVTRENFFNGLQIYGPGNYGTPERTKSLHTATRNVGTTAQIDTGWQLVSQDWYGATHIWLWVPEAPTTSNPAGVKVHLKEVYLYLDQQFLEYPVAKFWSTQQGANNGEFPVVMSWTNHSDTLDNDWFHIWPRLSIGATVSYNCATYEVTGAPLANCSFEKVKWLRLVPGNNVIQVNGHAGIGQVSFKIKWQNKN